MGGVRRHGMRFDRKRRLYDRLPGWTKLPLGWVPFRLLAGPSYRRTLARGAWIDRADAEAIAAWQERALGALLRFAVAQVPAYQALRGVVARCRPRDALQAFPLLSKDDLQDDMERHVARDLSRRAHYESTTGGTTGNQLRILLDDDAQAVEMGFMHRQWARVGYRPAARKATFRGVEFPRAGQGVLWQRNPAYNELQFSPFHMNEENLDRYWETILRYRPRYLHGYPSAIADLADHVARHERPFHGLRIRAALLGSEPLYPDQRLRIERGLRTRAYSWFGHSERTVLAGECEHDAVYHSFPDYGVLEILDPEGSAVGEGESGEVVGTGLVSRAMPLIRYRSGDFARRLPRECPCGRAHERFDRVVAHRDQEFVVGRTGTRMTLAALNMHGPAFARVRQYQYFQDAPGRMELRIVPAGTFGPDDEHALRAAFERKVATELEIRVVQVQQLERTARGKIPRLLRGGTGVHSAARATEPEGDG